jgi:anti-anti-sigma regulatory factor
MPLLREALLDADGLEVDLKDVSCADITTLQVLLAANKYSRTVGKRFTLALPLREVLPRSSPWIPS